MKKTNKKQYKAIVITGPTASGKSDLAVHLAKWLQLKNNRQKFSIKGAEIISADSRQVYRGLDIGSGKVKPDIHLKTNRLFVHQGIVHHCLDIASPRKRFTVAQYQKKAKAALKKILQKEKIAIICGGSGFYISSLIDGLIIPPIKPDASLRKKMEKLSSQDLFLKLKKLDVKRAKQIDPCNKRRLIRALEIIIKTKQPVPSLKKEKLPFQCLKLALKKDRPELKKLIRRRLLKRLKSGLIREVRSLRQSGLSWKKLEEFGLEYRFISYYLQKKISYKQMVGLLQKEIEHYAKRQATWLKKEEQLHWIRNKTEAKKLINKFLQN